MELNRGKQVHVSRGGSRSISNLVFQMTNPEIQMPPSPFDVYYKLHYNDKKKGWQNGHSKVEYAAMDKLEFEGTTITTYMERKLENEAIQSVCGKQKTIQSGWQVGVGPVLRKKDHWMKLRASSIQGAAESSESETNRNLKNEVYALKEQLKESNDKSAKMSDFLLAKFPDFESIVSTSVTNDAHGSDGLSGDSYNTT